jgi:hypothetical protein
VNITEGEIMDQLEDTQIRSAITALASLHKHGEEEKKATAINKDEIKIRSCSTMRIPP